MVRTWPHLGLYLGCDALGGRISKQICGAKAANSDAIKGRICVFEPLLGRPVSSALYSSADFAADIRFFLGLTTLLRTFIFFPAHPL